MDVIYFYFNFNEVCTSTGTFKYANNHSDYLYCTGTTQYHRYVHISTKLKETIPRKISRVL